MLTRGIDFPPNIRLTLTNFCSWHYDDDTTYNLSLPPNFSKRSAQSGMHSCKICARCLYLDTQWVIQVSTQGIYMLVHTNSIILWHIHLSKLHFWNSVCSTSEGWLEIFWYVIEYIIRNYPNLWDSRKFAKKVRMDIYHNIVLL